jgi:hypothetical protein
MNIVEKLKLIDSLKNKVDKLNPGKDWDDAFFRKVKLEFTYTSNKLEGNTLTYGQYHLPEDMIESLGKPVVAKNLDNFLELYFNNR